MTARTRHLITLSIGLALFALASLHSYPRICCMFGANRYYGWPFPYLNLHKEVETYEEAALVRTASARELLARGWRFDPGLDIESPGLIGSPLLNLLADLALALGAGAAAIHGYGRLIAASKSGSKK